MLIGYGFTAIKLKFHGVAVHDGGDKKTIDVDAVEILYDMAGRNIFLASYRTRLSGFERFMARLFSHRSDEKRKIVLGTELGEGFVLSLLTRRFMAHLLELPKGCIAGQTQNENGAIELPFDKDPFDELSRAELK